MNSSDGEQEISAEEMKRKTVYLERDVLRRGERRAKEDHRSFSNYVAQLIRKDCGVVAPAAAAEEKVA